MISGLGTVLDRLQNLLGKGYLLAGVLPFFILSVCVLVAGDYVFPAWRLARLSLAQLSFTDQWPYQLAYIVLLGLLGFVFWALNPWFRQVLEGRRLFPEFVRRMMSSAHQEKLDALDEKLDQLQPEVARFRRAMTGPPAGRWAVQLREAREKGSHEHAHEVAEDLKVEYAKLRRQRFRRERIAYDHLDQFAARLENELRSNNADFVPLLDHMQHEFLAISRYVSSKVESGYFSKWRERRAKYPGGDVSVAATRMGIIAQIPSDYAFTRYGLDLEAFWLLIQKRIIADDKFAPTVDDAKTQLGFAVGMTAAFALTAAFVFVANVYKGASVDAFAGSFAAAILMMRLFYEVAVQSYYGYTQAVKAAVDLYRFDVLKDLGVSRPTDSDAERTVWEQLTSRALADDKTKIAYAAPGP